jgi:hypothetical protein
MILRPEYVVQGNTFGWSKILIELHLSTAKCFLVLPFVIEAAFSDNSLCRGF